MKLRKHLHKGKFHKHLPIKSVTGVKTTDPEFNDKHEGYVNTQKLA